MPGLAAIVFPARCPGCGAPAEPVCAACRARAGPARPGPDPPGLDALVVPFAYDGVVREVVARAKYRGRHAALGWLAGAMADAVLARPGGAVAVDVVTWVPTTAVRRSRRGFDQSELLARSVATRLGRPVRSRLRRRRGPPQTGADRARRAAGPALEARGVVPGERLLLVDDVVTTGSTLRVAAGALRAGGAGAVLALAAARRG